MIFTAPLRGELADLVAALRQLSTPDRLQRIDAPGATIDLDQAIRPPSA
jgi:hypothetical protein